jgi:hypothetical protein
LISLIAIEDMGKQSWKTLHRFWPRKGDRQFSAVANFGELKQLRLRRTPIGFAIVLVRIFA